MSVIEEVTDSSIIKINNPRSQFQISSEIDADKKFTIF